MKFILGTKLNMTQVFDKEGNVYPVTIISAAPSTVVQVKTKENDGYSAIQLGFGERKAKNIKKPQIGHMKNLGTFKVLREFRLNDALDAKNVGDKIEIDTFAAGDTVEVSGISKGKGFQGVVKRHGFKGGPRSHGQKHSEREPGSISGGTREGGRVPKGMRMAGRTGSDRITVRNLKVVAVDKEKNEILIKGAIPGRRGTLVEIKG